MYNAAVTYGGTTVAAEEGTITTPLADQPGQSVSGGLVDVGRGCNGDPLATDPSGRIALIERGACAFTEKLANVHAAGAIGAIVYNSAAGGDAIITMAGTSVIPIPGVFVGRTSGLALQAAAPVSVTILSCARSATCRGTL